MAECEGRKCLAFEERTGCLAASSFRFFADAATDAELKAAHDAILHDKTADLRHNVFQVSQPMPQNGSVHKPATPSQGVLVLAETAKAGIAQGKHLPKPASYRRRAISQG